MVAAVLNETKLSPYSFPPFLEALAPRPYEALNRAPPGPPAKSQMTQRAMPRKMEHLEDKPEDRSHGKCPACGRAEPGGRYG
mmetsp:Transcript_37837/g.69875  ORF Transcript_37837/g.69875 Transcript_37837/m.69875 type:complete len:82 (+) Transcript_37837:3-248(+)